MLALSINWKKHFIKSKKTKFVYRIKRKFRKKGKNQKNENNYLALHHPCL